MPEVQEQRASTGRTRRGTLGALLFLGVFTTLASGCGAGIGLLVSFLSSSDGGSAGVDVAPFIILQSADTSASRDTVPVTFEARNEDGSNGLRARIEFVDGTRRELATPVAGSPHTTSEFPVRDREPVTFFWDAKTDLADRSAEVSIIVTPFEDSREGEADEISLLAGNTPPAVENVEASPSGDRVLVTFDVVDAESDPVDLTDVRLVVSDVLLPDEELSFVPLPTAIFDKVRKDHQSEPGQSFFFALSDLRDAGVDPQLRRLSETGFVGDLCIQLTIEDQDDSTTAEPACIRFDNNTPPTLPLVSVPENPASSIVPVHFRVRDDDGNPVEVEVEVDLGGGFEPAIEFPAPPSTGRSGVAPSDALQTFLWDAGSQLRGERSATIRLSARDREVSEDGTDLIDLRELPAFGFLQSREIPTGRRPQVLASGDLDRDGFPDLVVANTGARDIAVFFGSQDGLESSVTVELDDPPDGRPEGLAIADFDRDGCPDLAVTSRPDRLTLISWCELRQPLERRIPLEGESRPEALATGDFNGDGLPDLAVARTGSEAHIVMLFGPGLDIQKPIPLDDSPELLLAGDVNHDGFDDLTVTVTNSVWFLPGGAEGVTGTVRLAVEDGTVTAAVGCDDLDGDGYLDVLVGIDGSNGPNAVLVLRGAAKGLGPPERLLEVPSRPRALECGDYTGDGLSDVAIGSTGGLIFVSGGDDGPAVDSPHDLEGRTNALVSGDFNKDGFTDLVAFDNSEDVARFFAGGRGKLRLAGVRSVGPSPVTGLAADFNADGALDVIVGDSTSSSVWLLPGITSGISDQTRQVLPLNDSPLDLVPGDFDDDGFRDLLVALPTAVSLYRGGPDGLTQVGRDVLAEKAVEGLAAGNFEEGGHLEAAIINRASITEVNIEVFRIDPQASSHRRTLSLDGTPLLLAALNVNGDRFDDLAVVTSDPDALSVIPGTESGLDGEPALSVRWASRSDDRKSDYTMLRGDFNSDGLEDLVTARQQTDQVFLLSGSTGSPPELTRIGVPAGTFPASLAGGDFDGDGSRDLAIGGVYRVAWMRGGPGGLPEAEVFPIEIDGTAERMTSGDHDGDGFDDLVVAEFEGDRLFLLRGGPLGLSEKEVVTHNADAGFLFPEAIESGDFDGDGVVDLLVGSAELMLFFGGGNGRLAARTRRLSIGKELLGLVVSDFDGDGFVDVVAAGTDSDSCLSPDQAPCPALIQFRNRFGTPHVNVPLDAREGGKFTVVDPRHPARYRLDMNLTPEQPAIQPCIVPGRMIPLPRDAVGEGRKLVPVTDPVTLLRDRTSLDGPAMLTLKLRDPGILDTSGLRVFHLSADGEVAELVPGRLDRVDDLAEMESAAVRFPIERFGTYVVMMEEAGE